MAGPTKKKSPRRKSPRRKTVRAKKPDAVLPARKGPAPTRSVADLATLDGAADSLLGSCDKDTQAKLRALTLPRRWFLLYYAHADSPFRFRAQKAAVAAGYSDLSPSLGGRMLREPKMAALANQIAVDTVTSVFVSMEERRELMRTHIEGMLGVTVEDFGYVDEDGQYVLDLGRMAANPFAPLMVAEIDTVVREDAQGVKHTRSKVKLADRLKLIELYGKLNDVSAFSERVDLYTSADRDKEIRAARERLRKHKGEGGEQRGST
jgi:hypothetical protein